MTFTNMNPISLWNMVKDSLKDHIGKVSSTRINGYWMSILFTLCVLCCISIEIATAIEEYYKGLPCVVSNQLIAICVLILGQQALLFNLKKQSDNTSYPTLEKMNTENNILENNNNIVENNNNILVNKQP